MGENQIERHGNFDKQFEYLNYLIENNNPLVNDVKCIYTRRGNDKLTGIQGKLASCNPYESISFDDTIVRFVGELDAIVAIFVGENCLYYNKSVDVRQYNGYFNDPVGLIEAQSKMLGYSVKEEEMNRHNKTI